jgi:hypothetical protein
VLAVLLQVQTVQVLAVLLLLLLQVQAVNIKKISLFELKARNRNVLRAFFCFTKQPLNVRLIIEYFVNLDIH